MRSRTISATSRTNRYLRPECNSGHTANGSPRAQKRTILSSNHIYYSRATSLDAFLSTQMLFQRKARLRTYAAKIITLYCVLALVRSKKRWLGIRYTHARSLNTACEYGEWHLRLHRAFRPTVPTSLPTFMPVLCGCNSNHSLVNPPVKGSCGEAAWMYTGCVHALPVRGATRPCRIPHLRHGYIARPHCAKQHILRVQRDLTLSQ